MTNTQSRSVTDSSYLGGSLVKSQQHRTSELEEILTIGYKCLIGDGIDIGLEDMCLGQTIAWQSQNEKQEVLTLYLPACSLIVIIFLL